MASTCEQQSYDMVGARTAGSRHIAQQLPCQDYFAFDKGPNWAVAVVSDGAGSAARALDGARYATSEICYTVAATSRDRENRFGDRGPARGWLNNVFKRESERQATQEAFDEMKKAVIVGIERARERCLLEAEPCQRLESFHATVVGAILWGEIGLLFHIGDGGASAFRTTAKGIETIAFSAPENGEYINQTFFFTEARWQEHLRFTEIVGNFERVWLMTDGAYQLIVAPNSKSIREVTARQIEQIVFENGSEDKQASLTEILASAQASSRNGDDKTLVMIHRCRAAPHV